jgi:pimeloyl-ACP methyl ester carboxylesterase
MLEPSVSNAPSYRELVVARDGATDRERGLRPTPLRLAWRPEGGDEALIIFPGFGVSVSQMAIDRLIYGHSRRYGLFVTHDAVNYRTSHDFLLVQYVELLRRLPARLRAINVLGLSLGGTTAVQLLFLLLQREPALYRRFGKLVTLLSAISDLDFTPRWQNILRAIRELTGQGQEKRPRSQGELERMVRRTVLRVVARAIEKSVRSSCLEADSLDEIIASFSHFAEAYAPHTRALPVGALGGVEIVSIGLETDGMVREARAHRFARRGRHLTLAGEHTPSFYSQSKAACDRLLLAELG